jgi:flagellar biosynthetic protein FliR
MTLALGDILAWAQIVLSTGFAVFLRVGAAMALFPAFGERAIPERVRLALALSFTIIIAPAVAEPVVQALGGGFIRLLLSEVMAGLAIGAVVRLFVLALQMAGTIAAQATSLSQILGFAMADPQPAMGQILWLAGLTLAVMAGLHLRLAELLISSYGAFPPGELPGAALLAHWGTGHAAEVFALAFTLAAPFVIASLIYNVALGVINRAMPQLMVAFVGAPAITAGGLLLLLASAPILLSVWLRTLELFLSHPFGAG